MYNIKMIKQRTYRKSKAILRCGKGIEIAGLQR
jgi:hypothetical protein